MKVELTKKDIENLLNMINTTSFRGDSAELITDLKKKLKDAKNGK